jgi:plastocyanin
MKSDATGAVVGFDPAGVFLQPGQVVRWICDANVHTTIA